MTKTAAKKTTVKKTPPKTDEEINAILRPFQVKEEIARLIEKKKMKLDVGGHFCTGKEIKKYTREYLIRQMEYMAIRGMKTEECQHLMDVIEGKKEADRWIATLPSRLFECSECGQEVALEFNGREMRCTNPCPYPDGLPPYDIELNVPSGKMVVANDLRRWFPITGDYNVNLTINCKKTTEKYAEIGMAHAFVGNTCPGMYRATKGNDTFIIGTSPRALPNKRGKEVAGICTDLWWYSIVDYDDFLKRVGKELKNLKNYYTVVDCKPGVYRFRHQYHLVADKRWDRAVAYTYIDWVRDPDPIRDHKAEWDALDFTAGQILADNMKRYGETFGNTPKHLQRYVDQLLMVCGSGNDYHPNGWMGDNPDLKMDAPEMKIPRLTGKYHWYPIDKWSAIVNFAGIGEDLMKVGLGRKLNDSFLSLAFNALHCIVKYGVDDSDQKRAKNTVQWADKALRAFVKKYPDKVPGYVKKFLKAK